MLSVPLGRKEHMVRDYAPLAVRKLDVRLYAQWTQEDDWSVRLPPARRSPARPRPPRVQPVRDLFRRRDDDPGLAPREDDGDALEDAHRGERVRARSEHGARRSIAPLASARRWRPSEGRRHPGRAGLCHGVRLRCVDARRQHGPARGSAYGRTDLEGRRGRGPLGAGRGVRSRRQPGASGDRAQAPRHDGGDPIEAVGELRPRSHRRGPRGPAVRVRGLRRRAGGRRGRHGTAGAARSPGSRRASS